MQMQPILEVFVVWHPDDEYGQSVFNELYQHFHSRAYSGLAGGAVEVYPRSASWKGADGPPRQIPVPEDCGADLLPSQEGSGLLPAQYVAVVPVFGSNMRKTVQQDLGWHHYMERIAAAAKNDRVIILPVFKNSFKPKGSKLHDLFHPIQSIRRDPQGSDEGDFERNVAQAITQMVARIKGRIRIFISHTKQFSDEETTLTGTSIYKRVRSVIGDTKLDEFFDATDLQYGQDWMAELDEEVKKCALLMVRTDLYASRKLTQHEVLVAKRHDVPFVTLVALTNGEARGSFLMDHVPTVPLRASPAAGSDTSGMKGLNASIKASLNRLVDESLKHALWSRQMESVTDRGNCWTPMHAPEPVTAINWLITRPDPQGNHSQLLIFHPDPPLGQAEQQVTNEVFEIAGFKTPIDIFTPRTLAARGGALTQNLSKLRLIPPNALNGVRITLSVSESPDLSRLGLDKEHLNLTVAEIARAIVIAGGIVIYGGRINQGFTKIIQEQSERYARNDLAFEHLVPYSEHAHLTLGELEEYEDKLEEYSRVYFVGSDGDLRLAIKSTRGETPCTDAERVAALTSMRQVLAERCDMSIVVGGRFRGQPGVTSGVIEEAGLMLERRKPLYVAGGFGGAAAYMGRLMTPDLYDWLPQGIHENFDHKAAESRIHHHICCSPENGLTSEEKAALATTNRPADIAALTILGMSRLNTGEQP